MRTEALKMAGKIRHRGPDWSGSYSDDHCILMHERLSIVDVEHGAQPLYDTKTKRVLGVNGEIYNHKELNKTGDNPTYLYGYGGFNISRKPYFNKTIPVILENEGVYAIANIRGGGEYGQEWHEAVMLDKKQNVFDYFIYISFFA